MRRRISLYIADKLVDLDGDSLILFNYKLEELQNPAIVKNAYSQQIKLQGTPNNNKIFGGLWRSDRVTNDVFDTMRKEPFVIYAETGEILESGYVKVDNVQNERGNVTYSVTLYGGLGSFFYELSYKADGTKKSIADLTFSISDSAFNIDVTKSSVESAWSYLSSGSGDPLWGVINFAPAYNGLPEGNFDANKAVVNYDRNMTGLYSSKTQDGKTYTLLSNHTLLSFPEKVTEWEAKDLRCYLQRPVLNAMALLNAICNPANNGGYTVNVDADILSGYLDGAWITLPMLKNEKKQSVGYLTASKTSLLGGLGTPATWLLNFAKMLNWRFIMDKDSKTVRIVANHNFWTDNVKDISRLVDLSKGISLNPLPMSKRWMQYTLKDESAFSAKYKADYGRDYGSRNVDTNYPFNADTENVLSSVTAKAAPFVVETSKMFTTITTSGEYGTMTKPTVLLLDNCMQTLWTSNGEQIQLNTSDLVIKRGSQYFTEGADMVPKIQLHKEDNKANEGSGVLCWFVGMADCTGWGLRLTQDDVTRFTDWNNSTPCWIFDYSVPELTSIPQFSRYKRNRLQIVQSWDYGNPAFIGVPGLTISDDAPIYDRLFKSINADRYDKDTKIMKCRVRWDEKVNEELFRKFYWYDGAIWALNSISNHSLTTFDPTECEFIKVQDIDNYMSWIND